MKFYTQYLSYFWWMDFLKKLFDFNALPVTILNNAKQWRYFVLACIAIRFVFFLSDGHNSDFDFFEHWGDRIVQEGLTNIYSIKVDRFECDYPPLYLYLITPIAYLFHFMQWDMHTQIYDSFLKLFNVLAEFAFLLYFYRKTNNKIFLAAMLLSPATMINAYGWGQIDIFYSILMFLGFYSLLHGKLYQTAIWVGISLSLKTQTLLFLPIFGLLYLFSNNSIKEKIGSLLLLVVVFIIPNIPFLLWAPIPMDSINPHISAAGRYNFISVNAFNFYWAIWADFALKMQLKFPSNDALVFGLISRKILAYSLFSIAFAWILWQVYQYRKSPIKVIALLSLYCFTYFMLLPEMHERYLFPMFIFSALLLSADPKEWPYFLMISILHSINLFWAWGENKFVKEAWLFEPTRIIALLTGLMWLLYFIRIRNFITYTDTQSC